jgi:hypothetical protein
MRVLSLAVCAVLLAVALPAPAQTAAKSAAAPKWSFNATIIEACSCPMFCQCYFNTKPADAPGCCPEAATGERFCRFNNAFKVNRGSFGDVKLDGIEFWVAGDLGGDFSEGQMNWAVVHFEPSTTKAQRDAIATVLGRLYPVKWKAFQVGKDADMTWTHTKDRAEAKLDGGKTAEVVLKRNEGMTSDPIVIHNLRYWGAPRNDGFVLMANEVEAYRAGEKPYEFKGTNGFMITVDITSMDGGSG